MTTPNQFDKQTVNVFIDKGYRILQLINVGSFGDVYKSLYNETEVRAVKVIDLRRVGKRTQDVEICREIAALIQFKHPNIIKLFDAFRANQKIFLFMEFADNKDVGKYLESNGPIGENVTGKWFKQISNALNYIHNEMGFVHRDIKVDNILLFNNYDLAKLADFGLARYSLSQQTNQIEISHTICGTDAYISPKQLLCQGYNPVAADCWSMGVTLFTMLNNKLPFGYCPAIKQLNKLRIGGAVYVDKLYDKLIIDKLSRNVREVIDHLIVYDEDKRWKITDVLKSKWFKNI
ncbi:testis-specific serine/threonine-protein kinase 4-like [Oppia nitens]|uniref:testis-specific serine/threonine-protein kinase 4-like n=1 Tax=Oppia nitens TaxID=1686743 RepID=UPI0023DA0ED8|nr:testis-specific serine/threonine-protein kinase 4-like [Oppia nitens]